MKGQWLKLDMSPGRLFALGETELFNVVIKVSVAGYVPPGVVNLRGPSRLPSMFLSTNITKGMLDALEQDPNVISVDGQMFHIN